MRVKIIIILILTKLVILSAGNTGKVMGKVTDQDGKPISNAVVYLKGTGFDYETDEKGVFILIDISPGNYTLECYARGKEKKESEIKINIDLTTTCSFKLSASQEESSLIDNSISDYSSFYAYYYSLQEYREYPKPVVEHYLNSNTEKTIAVTDLVSSFKVNYDNASYYSFRNHVLSDILPPMDKIYAEDFINFFHYEYEQPKKDPVSINLEYGKCPWNKDSNLLHIGIQAKELTAKVKRKQIPNNIIFLIDDSASMYMTGKLPLFIKNFSHFLDSISERDLITLATCNGSQKVILPSTKAKMKKTIIKAVESLLVLGKDIETVKSENPLLLGYQIARENFIKNGNNRIFLVTDGNFQCHCTNVRNLADFIKHQHENGISLSVIGFSVFTFYGLTLSNLSESSNGELYLIYNDIDAQEIFSNELSTSLYNINVSESVEITVDFNPSRISGYRLLGYERYKTENNSIFVSHKGENFGYGHSVTAIYEVFPVNPDSVLTKSKSRYIDSYLNRKSLGSNELLTVSFNYQDIEDQKERTIKKVLTSEPLPIENTSENFRFSAAVAELTNLLKDSAFKGTSNLEDIRQLARNANKYNYSALKSEFIELCESIPELLEKQKQCKKNWEYRLYEIR